MPDHLKSLRIPVQGGKLYLPAAVRLEWFRSIFPNWGVDTVLLEGGQAAGFATVKAVITDEEGRIIASGMKTETKQDFPAGWVEKAETGAIARALVVAGFPSADSSEFSTAPPRDQQGAARPPKTDNETITAQQAWFEACSHAGIEDEAAQRETMAAILSAHFTEIAGEPRSIKCPPNFRPTVDQYRIAAKTLLEQMTNSA
jgi:hypothetical protein